MIIPKQLKIGGRTYDIIYPHRFTDSANVLYGLHDSGGQKIMISNIDSFGCVRHPESVAQTFMHETMHAIDNVYFGGKLTEWVSGENAIDQIAEGLLQVIRDNNLNFKKG